MKRYVDWHAVMRSAPLYALIAIAAGLSYGYHQLLLGQRDRVEHTYQVLTALETTLVRCIDAETGQRGYVITGDDRYLAPYALAVAERAPMLSRLDALVQDSLAQRNRVVTLTRLLRDEFAGLQQSIDVRRQAGLAAASDLVRLDDGRRQMDAVRALMAEMRAAEVDLLAQRSAEARATERRLWVVTVTCAMLSLAARALLALRS